MLLASASQAGILNVTLSTDITATDFTIQTDGVFGVSPMDMTFSVTLAVDTSTGVDSANAGDPTDGSTFARDVWGYNVVSATATFGSKTWVDSDIVLLDFGDGIDDSLLFVDTELTGGATPTLASFRMQNDGFLFFGVRACGVACDIQDGVQIRDFNGGALNDGGNDFILTDHYSIAVAAVPEPTTMLLLGLGLVGLGISRRRTESSGQ
jgi:hypothetical protein